MAERLWTALLAARRFLGQPTLSPAFARALGRARWSTVEAGELAQLRRVFRVRPAGSWPSAALIAAATRSPGDLVACAWLRADPVWLQAELCTARLMAWGGLGLDAAEADALLSALKPSFGDAGFPIEALGPESWLVQCPRAARLPSFPHPLEALGMDAFTPLSTDPETRRWQALLGEAQILLHQHPVNHDRLARGLPPANSLWFWGGGVLPDAVEGPRGSVASSDPELRAYARAAGCELVGSIEAVRAGLVDLRSLRHWPAIESPLSAALAALGRGDLDRLLLDFADGQQVILEPAQRWRFWRPAAPGLGA